MKVVFDFMRTCFFVFPVGATAPSLPVAQLLPAHSRTHENQGKAGKVIPERASPDTSDALLSAVLIKEVCGTGDDAAGLFGRDARKGFPDDMLRARSNALFYVHGEAWEQLLCPTAGADACRR
jgi:hypothetical protein